MKNFFIATIFIISLTLSSTSIADVRSVAEPPAPRSTDAKKNNEALKKLYKEIPNLNDKKAVKEYIHKRLKIAQKVKMNAEELSSPQSVSIVDPNNLEEINKQTLSAYEKIYKESMQRAQDSNVPLNANVKLDGTFYELVHPGNNMEAFVPDFPYVTIKLSDKKEIMAPAEEHIAYMLTTIKIETNGIMRVTEEFILVSNNESFPQGFFRILPKYNYNTHSKRRLDLTLSSVTINGEEYPYKVTEIGNNLYIEPQKPIDLPTGIYTYKFNYLIDRTIWYHDNFDEFYWDLSGRTLQNVVGSANALVILPIGSHFLGQNAIASTRKGLNDERVTIVDLDENTVAFADTEALAVGDDIHIFITLEKGTIYAPDFSKKYFWFIQDYGSVLFALIALLAIYLAYKISLKQIRLNQDKTRAQISKTPATFRLINTNIFDIRSLFAEILDLVAKNIIDLQENNQTAVFIKKTDNLKRLPKTTAKLMAILFPGAETSLPATDISKLKLERAYKYLRQETYRKYRLYSLKLNGAYLICSFVMLLCGMIASSSVAINPWHTFWIIFICTLLMLPYIYLCLIKPKKKWLEWIIKGFAGLSILGISGWMAIYTSYVYTALIIISVSMIIYYYRAFSRRNGLLRNKIKETEEYKSYLQKNPELAVSARDFPTRIPYIYAFSLENKYKDIATFDLLNQYETLLNNKKG